MTRRLVAFLMVLVISVSLVSVAYATDVIDGGCQHMSISTQTTESYSNPTASGHTCTRVMSPRCNVCGEIVGNSTTSVTQQSHKSDGKTYDYHSGSNHVFYKKCVQCKGNYGTMTVACPGNPHVNIVLSVHGEVQ